MTRTIIETTRFTKQWHELGLSEEDLRLLQNHQAERKSMSTLYQDLMDGFQEILEAQKTGKKMKSSTITIPDVHHYSNKEIKQIRNRAGLTQTLFAGFMGVSKKTVEAWERGTNRPTGPACRLLALIEAGGINAIKA